MSLGPPDSISLVSSCSNLYIFAESSGKHKSETNPDLDLTKQFQFMSIKVIQYFQQVLTNFM